LASKRDFYEVLGVSQTSSADDIKGAYRRLARQHHPDVNPGDGEAENRFKEINEAYEVLSDANKRARYDRYGHAGVGSGTQSPSDFGFGGFGAGGFTDIFDAIFGGGREPRGGPHGPERGADLRYDLQVTLEEATFGAEKRIAVTRLEPCTQCKGTGAREGTTAAVCPTCKGHGQVRSSQNTFLGSFTTVTTCPRCGGEGSIVQDPCPRCRGEGRERKTHELTVQIPRGVESGTRIRYSGQGEGGTRGGIPGDLYVVVYVQPHPVFERQGRDVICEMTISFAKAALGGRIEVPTLDGKETLHLPEGTQPGDVFRVPGKGLPEMGRQSRGDQHVLIQVATPTHLNERQRKALLEFAAASGEEVGETEDASLFEKVRNIFAGKRKE
jgi:molecular chaperone DnaJ